MAVTKSRDGNYRPKHRVKTFGELVDFLSQFPREWSIGAYDAHGVPRKNLIVESTSISTLLSSEGEEIDF